MVQCLNIFNFGHAIYSDSLSSNKDNIRRCKAFQNKITQRIFKKIMEQVKEEEITNEERRKMFVDMPKVEDA